MSQSMLNKCIEKNKQCPRSNSFPNTYLTDISQFIPKFSCQNIFNTSIPKFKYGGSRIAVLYVRLWPGWSGFDSQLPPLKRGKKCQMKQ